jgi:hypothetical protein
MIKVFGGDVQHVKVKMDDADVADIVPGTLMYLGADGLVTMGSSHHMKDLNGLVYMSLDYYANILPYGYVGAVNVQDFYEAEIADNHAGEAVTLGMELTIKAGVYTEADATGDHICAVVKEANSGTATTDTWKITTRCRNYLKA